VLRIDTNGIIAGKSGGISSRAMLATAIKGLVFNVLI